MMNKVIILDYGIFLHRSIFSWINTRQVPPTYTCMNMIMSCLKRIGVNKEDKIIVAVDSPLGSWRKKYDKFYKANRKEKRQSYNVNWEELYSQFDNLLERLNISTDWNIIKIDYLEADDIMAVAPKYFKDKEVILVSYDSDLEMLWAYDNVKIFSPHPKSKMYKIRCENPYQILAKKIKKEISDNLVTAVTNQEEFENRKKIVDLIHLPQEIEDKVTFVFNNLELKKLNLEQIPFRAIRESYMDIYETKNIITYEDSIKKKSKKKNKRRNKNGMEISG